MSQISPHERFANERSLNWTTAAVFLGIVAVFFLALWLSDPALFKFDPAPATPSRFSGNVNVDIEAEATTNRLETKWAAQIAEVEQEWPNDPNSDYTEMKEQLWSVAHVLASKKLPFGAQKSIQNELDEVRQRVIALKAQADRENLQVKDMADALDSTAQSILVAEKDAKRRAIEQALKKAHEKLDPIIRKIQLEVQDQRDEATRLREQIVLLQREQAETRDKAARLSSLRADMADVNRYLKPFTSHGHLQPISDRNPWNTKRTADAKPVSLAGLKRLGALENTMEGLERLYIFGGYKNNSRPLGSFPQYWAQQLDRKPEVLNAVNRAQQLLRKHGQALVEERLLSE